METLDDMTPRQRTYALKKHGLKIISTYCTDDDGVVWMIEFSNGDIDQVMNQSTFKRFDGKRACEYEAREIATYNKLKAIINHQ
jgi:hypothetical protein